jgi:hypothetical protein
MSEQQSRMDSLVTTRESLHRVAEHVLSAARKRETGSEIALRPGPGGVRTPPLGATGLVLALIGPDIAVVDGDVIRRAPLTTVRAAAEFVGVEPGFPWTKHPPGTPFTPDEPLSVDPQAAEDLASWFALGDQALDLLAAGIAPGDDITPQIYPEHFDLAISVDQVNYGASPGDESIPVPYVYVGPHEGPPTRDAYWNAFFGAFLTMTDVTSPEDALTFFRAGRDRLAELAP